MIEFLDKLDTTLFLAINGHHSPFFDTFMTLFTSRFIWVPMYVMVAWLLFHKQRWQTGIIYLLCLVGAIALTDQTCATFIRPAVERLRPSNIENAISSMVYIVDGYRGGSYGFPSCHAANSFALATFLCLFVKRRGFTIFILSWALLNSYSRLYLGVHYPGDLLIGALIGAIFGALCYYTGRHLTLRLPGILPTSTLAEGCRMLVSTPSSQMRSNAQGGTLQRVSATSLTIATFFVTIVIIALFSIQ